jgi:hypothetical protein
MKMKKVLLDGSILLGMAAYLRAQDSPSSKIMPGKKDRAFRTRMTKNKKSPIVPESIGSTPFE